MTERTFRLILVNGLLLLVYIDYTPLFYVYLFVLIFEGVTIWRIPLLINKIRYSTATVPNQSAPDNQHSRFSFEAERAMRLVFAAVLIPAIFLLPRDLWYINWIIASFLTLAGLVNFCPTVFTLRHLGFR